MKKGGPDRHKPLLSALQKAGFTVDTIEQQGKKTVITVTPAVENAESEPKNGKEPPQKPKQENYD